CNEGSQLIELTGSTRTRVLGSDVGCAGSGVVAGNWQKKEEKGGVVFGQEADIKHLLRINGTQGSGSKSTTTKSAGKWKTPTLNETSLAIPIGLETERSASSSVIHVGDLKAQLLNKGIAIRVISPTSVSRPQLKSNRMEDRVMLNNSQGKKQEVEEHRRNVKFSKNKTPVGLR
nr:hypothetical protein [Tanacetum cinerariifolium]